MNKIKIIIIGAIVILFISGNAYGFGQEDVVVNIVIDNDLAEEENIEKIIREKNLSYLDDFGPSPQEELLSIIPTHLIIIFLLFSYFYVSFFQMILAKRMGLDHTWVAFIPILNINLLAEMGGINSWPVYRNSLLSLIPLIGIIYLALFTIQIFSCWHSVFNYFNKKWYWLLLFYIPIINFFVMGILIFQTRNYLDKKI
jgi:hypothetical protein